MSKLKIIFIIASAAIVAFVIMSALKNYFPEQAVSKKATPDLRFQSKSSRETTSKIVVNRIYSQENKNTEDTTAQSLSEPRLFDDIIKATETFSPILVPLISFYVYKKKKVIDKGYTEQIE